MQLNLFKDALSKLLDSESVKQFVEKSMDENESNWLVSFFGNQEATLMRGLSVLSKVMGETAQDDPEPTLDNLLLTEALFKTNWLDKKQLEPQEVLDYIHKEFPQKGLAIAQLERNVDSVVLIGRKEMLAPGSDNQLNTQPLSKGRLLVWDKERDGERRTRQLSCGIAKNFPYIEQETVQRNVSKIPGQIEPAFFGTGFFISENEIATAGHVVQALKKAKEANAEASFVVVQRYRLSDRALIQIKKFDIVEESILNFEGKDGQLEDWGRLSVDGKVEHWVDMSGDFNCGLEVYCLGHGLGLPLKMSWNGMLFKKGDNMFRCKLESFAGNSGSPVFSAHTHKAIGILSGNDGEVYDINDQNGHGSRFCTVLPIVYLHAYNGAVCNPLLPLMDIPKQQVVAPELF